MALSRRHIVPAEEPPKPEPQGPTKADIIAKLLSQVESTDTDERLARLHKIATRPLSLLSPEQCADLKTIKELSRSTYGTDAYPVLHTKVMNLFAPEGRVLVYNPHTIGSFFVGCVIRNNLTEASPDLNPGCALTCGDGMPPVGKGWGFCSQNVLWCMWSSRGPARLMRRHNATNLRMDHGNNPLDDTFDFFYVTYVPSSSRAVIFLDYQTYDEFPGFTRHEKARLIHRLGITDAKLLSYDYEPNSVNYKDLIGKSIKVLSIKPRADPRDFETVAQRTARRAKIAKKSGTTNSVDTSGPMTWQEATTLAIALALLVLLVISAAFLISHIQKAASAARSQRTKWRT